MKASTILALTLLTAALPASAAPAGYKLVWFDEFDQPGLPDPAKWGHEVGFIRNNEAQFYTAQRKENARVEDGHLVIEARKEKFSRADAPGVADRGWKGKAAADYTSASITTEGKASWTYGRIEVRAKLPPGRGTWPAIWMLGNSRRTVGWPTCGEIDIMEFVGYEPGVIHANVHMKKYNHAQGTGKGDKIKVPDATQAFHVYAVEWYEDRMEFFVDDQKYFTFKNENAPGVKNLESWPFSEPHYLILNLAIGGAWGGQKGIDESSFPTRYYIDYVRVYQKQ